MGRLELKYKNQFRRQNKVRKTVNGSSERPRLSVVVSNRHVSAQIIDDSAGKTLVSSTSIGHKNDTNLTKVAIIVGKDIAQKAKTKKLKEVKFDRGSKLYHGRIKAFADSAREEGLKF